MRTFILICVGAFLCGCGANLPFSLDSGLHLSFNTAITDIAATIPIPAFFDDEPVFESIPGKAGHHAATIVAFDDGELLAGWYSYDADQELAGSAIYLARKPAGGTWTIPVLHIDRPKGDGNPVLYRDGDRVWLFQAVVPFGWSTSYIEFQASDDRGHTWSSPAVLTNQLGANVKYPPLRLADGTLLLPAYSEVFNGSTFFASADGLTWQLRSLVTSTPGNIQPSIVGLENGRILSVMRNVDKGELWTMASDDGGTTWSTPQDSGFPNPASAAQLLKLASGNLVLIYNDNPEHRRPLSIALSADEGKIWTAPKILADGDSTYSYPSAIQSPDGNIHIVYSHARDMIRHITINEAWILSK